MDDTASFWKVMRGELPPPQAAVTLGLQLKVVDGEAGAAEIEFQARAAFTNPAGHIQGGFLAARLDDVMSTARTATLAAGGFAPTLNSTSPSSARRASA